jgi:hypothetical protein
MIVVLPWVSRGVAIINPDPSLGLVVHDADGSNRLPPLRDRDTDVLVLCRRCGLFPAGFTTDLYSPKVDPSGVGVRPTIGDGAIAGSCCNDVRYFRISSVAVLDDCTDREVSAAVG